MDIWLIGSEDGAKVQPVSIHGMLWLQTHFDNSHWSALASRQVRLSSEDIKELVIDAKQAGLIVNYLPSVSIAGKI